MGTGTVNNGNLTFNADKFQNLMLWLDANKSESLDKGGAFGSEGSPVTGDTIGYWGDLSGNSNNATPHLGDSAREPTYLATGLNGKPAIYFDGIDDILVAQNSATFDDWENLTVFIVAEGNNTADWSPLISKNGEDNQGWQFGKRNGTQSRWRVHGTSGAVDQNLNLNPDAIRIWSLTYGDGTRKSFGDGLLQASLTDTGKIATAPNSPLAIGALIRNNGNLERHANLLVSEVLVFKRSFAEKDRKLMEGYLAHKWGLDGNLDSSHPYKSIKPGEPSNGVDLTLYWGTADGATTPNHWEHSVELGKYFSEVTDSGFQGTGYLVNPNASYFNEIETLRALAPQVPPKVINGEPDDFATNGFNFDGPNDFINSGIGINRNNNYMDLWISDFRPKETGDYIFRMDRKDDYVTIWIDLDQNGLFQTTGDKGNEWLGGTNNFNSSPIPLIAGQSYKIALAHGQGGGGSSFRAWIETPTLSDRVINPLEPAQDGLYKAVTGLSNGAPQSSQIKLETEIENLQAGTTYYYRLHGSNSLGSVWAENSKTFVAEKKINLSTGSLTFKTDGPTPSWYTGSGQSGKGSLVSNSYIDQEGNSITYDVAKFDFASLYVGDGAKVHLTGSNTLEIAVSGDATILVPLDLNGTEGTDPGNSDLPGRLGGGHGGHEWYRTEQILGDQAADQATSPTHPVSIQEENHSPEWLGMQVSPPVKNRAVVDTVGEAVGRKPT